MSETETPAEVRALVRERYAMSAERMGRPTLASQYRDGRFDRHSDVIMACECVMADRAARPAASGSQNAEVEPAAWAEIIDDKVATVRPDKSRFCTEPLYRAASRPAEEA